MKIRELKINIGISYPIYLGNDLLRHKLLEICSSFKKRLALLCDARLVATLGSDLKQILQEAGKEVEIFSIPSGEIYKTRETKQQLEDMLLEKKYGRDSCFIALGGGMTTDLVGYLASTYCRGVPFIALPTTLLAMVDASIGGKTGVNTPHGKNLIGTFYQPTVVIMDTDVLKTLPKKEWLSGIVEMIKHGVIADLPFFQLLQASQEDLFQSNDILLDLIEQNLQVKKKIVEQDERESGERELLNFGHTIGHAIEYLEHYYMSHGEAVAIGMLVEAHMAMQLGFLNKEDVSAIKKLLLAYELPLQTRAFENRALFLNQLLTDKKSKAREPHFVMLEKIGKARHEGNSYSFRADSQILETALDWAQKEFETAHC